MSESVLGPMERRTKTDMRLPYNLIKRVEEIAEALGVPKNAVFAIAASKLCIEMAPMLSKGKKRVRLVDEMEHLISQIVREIKRTI